MGQESCAQMPLGAQSCPRRHEQVIAQTFEEAIYLLHVRSRELFALDGVGARIWALCDGAHTVDEMIVTIEQEFDAPHYTIAADVRALLGELIDGQLVLA
jgi:hypothetical protein